VRTGCCARLTSGHAMKHYSAFESACAVGGGANLGYLKFTPQSTCNPF
jgi:hypothetical protein